MTNDMTLWAVMKKSRMVEPAFATEREALIVRDGYRRDARDERYQVRMITVHEPPEWLSDAEVEQIVSVGVASSAGGI